MSNVDLLNMNPNRAFKISNAAFGSTGNSVSSVGDINGDGFNDIVIGAPRASLNSKSDAGVAYVMYGKNGGMNGIDTASIDLASLTAVQGFKILGAVANDQTGYSVSSAGDINGDGVNDIVVGAMTASPSGRPQAGAAYVIYGKNGGLANIDLASLTAAQGFAIWGASYNTGYSVSSAGDINGDGVNDIVVGAPFYYGAAYVIYGKSGGLANVDLASFSTAQGFAIYGAAANDRTGWSVSIAKDINGDGLDDIAVGAYQASPNGKGYAGVTYVIYGKSGGLANINLASLTAAQGFVIMGAASNDYAGSSVSSAGDINNDGFNDIIVGAPGTSPNGVQSAGIAYVIYGKSGGLANIDLASFTATQGFMIMGAASNDYAGSSVSSAGDINW